MKYLLWIMIIGALGIGAYYYWFAKDDAAPETSTDAGIEASGEVVAVDLGGMALDGPALITIKTNTGEEHTIAVPSMGLPLCEVFARIAAVDSIEVGDSVSVKGAPEGSRIVPCADASHYLQVTGVVYDDTHGYTFTYPKGPDGYVEVNMPAGESQDLRSGVMLFNSEEYKEFQESTEPREGPPSISVRVYDNPPKKLASVWARENPRESNIELATGDPEDRTVGGASAVHYTADGLFPIDTYVIAHDDYIYVLSGMYPGKNAPIYEDFQSLVSSFTFVPTEAHSKG